METGPAKKANKAKIPLEAIYPLEWEARALQEVSQGFQMAWRTNPERFEKLTEENESINAPIPPLESESKELIALYEKTFRLLILREPFLYRMLVYISLPPEDLKARKAFFKRYLQKVRMETYHDSLDQDVLVGSDLAKSRKLSGIPVHSCFVGKVLQWMLNSFEDQRLTDEGNPELVRFERIPKGLLIEYMNKADFDSPLADNIADDILYKAINNAQKDRRQHVFFGKSLDDPEWKIIKRFGKKEKEIRFHLLPKYAGLIRKRANIGRKYKGTKVISGNESPSEQWKDFEQKAVMLFMEAVLDQTPGKAKRAEVPFAAFIENQLLWRQKAEREAESFQKNGKRIFKSEIEKSGSSLDDFIDREEKDERRIDSLDGISPEAAMLEKENSDLEEAISAELRKNPRLVQIIKIKESGGRMSPEDQKYRWRKIIEFKNKFGLPG